MISFARNHQISSVNIETSVAKKNLVRRFLTIFINHFEDVIKENTKKNSTPKELLDGAYTLFSGTYEEAKTCSIPDIFIEKYKVMVDDHMSWMFDILGNIAASNEYLNEHDKMCAMLQLLTAILEFVFVNSESLLEEMNGELEAALKGSIFDK